MNPVTCPTKTGFLRLLFAGPVATKARLAVFSKKFRPIDEE